MVTKARVSGSGRWIRVSEALPEPWYESGGTWFSRHVVVEYRNLTLGVDNVMYPHGIGGHPRDPKFAGHGYVPADDGFEVEFWLDAIIPERDGD